MFNSGPEYSHLDSSLKLIIPITHSITNPKWEDSVFTPEMRYDFRLVFLYFTAWEVPFAKFLLCYLELPAAFAIPQVARKLSETYIPSKPARIINKTTSLSSLVLTNAEGNNV